MFPAFYYARAETRRGRVHVCNPAPAGGGGVGGRGRRGFGDSARRRDPRQPHVRRLYAARLTVRQTRHTTAFPRLSSPLLSSSLQVKYLLSSPLHLCLFTTCRTRSCQGRVPRSAYPFRVSAEASVPRTRLIPSISKTNPISAPPTFSPPPTFTHFPPKPAHPPTSSRLTPPPTSPLHSSPLHFSLRLSSPLSSPLLQSLFDPMLSSPRLSTHIVSLPPLNLT